MGVIIALFHWINRITYGRWLRRQKNFMSAMHDFASSMVHPIESEAIISNCIPDKHSVQFPYAQYVVRAYTNPDTIILWRSLSILHSRRGGIPSIRSCRLPEEYRLDIYCNLQGDIYVDIVYTGGLKFDRDTREEIYEILGNLVALRGQIVEMVDRYQSTACDSLIETDAYLSSSVTSEQVEQLNRHAIKRQDLALKSRDKFGKWALLAIAGVWVGIIIWIAIGLFPSTTRYEVQLNENQKVVIYSTDSIHWQIGDKHTVYSDLWIRDVVFHPDGSVTDTYLKSGDAEPRQIWVLNTEVESWGIWGTVTPEGKINQYYPDLYHPANIYGDSTVNRKR